MKGIILAGGKGTRLHPATLVTSKHLLSVYDKPMIFYPLTTLILAGAKEIMLIVNPEDLNAYKALMEKLEIKEIDFHFCVQNNPGGLPEAFLLAEDFIGNSSVCLILGDNFFHGTNLGKALQDKEVQRGASIFAYHVSNPEDYGVVKFGPNGQVERIVEKPKEFVSNYAIPGLYFFDGEVTTKSRLLTRSARGELEIVDLLNLYLAESSMITTVLPRGTVWMDMGTADSLFEVSHYVRTIQKRQGLEIGNPISAVNNL